MTEIEIKARLAKIEEEARSDDEVAHSLEDDLYYDFVKDIAKGQSNQSKRARLILTTEEMDFARWCA